MRFTSPRQAQALELLITLYLYEPWAEQGSNMIWQENGKLTCFSDDVELVVIYLRRHKPFMVEDYITTDEQADNIIDHVQTMLSLEQGGHSFSKKDMDKAKLTANRWRLMHCAPSPSTLVH